MVFNTLKTKSKSLDKFADSYWDQSPVIVILSTVYCGLCTMDC